MRTFTIWTLARKNSVVIMCDVKGLKFVVFRGGAGEVNKPVPHRDKVLAHPVGVAGYADLVRVFVVPGKVFDDALEVFFEVPNGFDVRVHNV